MSAKSAQKFFELRGGNKQTHESNNQAEVILNKVNEQFNTELLSGAQSSHSSFK